MDRRAFTSGLVATAAMSPLVVKAAAALDPNPWYDVYHAELANKMKRMMGMTGADKYEIYSMARKWLCVTRLDIMMERNEGKSNFKGLRYINTAVTYGSPFVHQNFGWGDYCADVLVYIDWKTNKPFVTKNRFAENSDDPVYTKWIDLDRAQS